MKHTITFALLFGLLSVQAQLKDRTFERANGSINLLGIATLERMKEEPFGEWYQESHEEYQVNDSIQFQLPDSITIFMGTWCGDSRREVPRFIKILEAKEFDMEKLKIICLNTGFQNYKQAPEREEAGVDIHRVPTFIFHNEEKAEIGRIVEEPVVSLEQDFSDVMTGVPYETYYPVANDLISKFKEYSLKELRKMMPKLVKQYQGKPKSIYELNTYGYVLWTSFDLMKAEFVLELNAKIHPDSAIPLTTLASFKRTMGKEKEALSNIKKGLAIDPENERLTRMMSSY